MEYIYIYIIVKLKPNVYKDYNKNNKRIKYNIIVSMHFYIRDNMIGFKSYGRIDDKIIQEQLYTRKCDYTKAYAFWMQTFILSNTAFNCITTFYVWCYCNNEYIKKIYTGQLFKVYDILDIYLLFSLFLFWLNKLVMTIKNIKIIL
jgi:hypothetical protein